MKHDLIAYGPERAPGVPSATTSSSPAYRIAYPLPLRMPQGTKWLVRNDGSGLKTTEPARVPMRGEDGTTSPELVRAR